MGFQSLQDSELKGLGPSRFEASGDFTSENEGIALQDYPELIECMNRVLTIKFHRQRTPRRVRMSTSTRCHKSLATLLRLEGALGAH